MSNPTLPNWSELTPSYGRDYPTAKAVKEAFVSAKDFTFAATGQQTSIRDVAIGDTVLLRYKRHTQVTTVKVTKAMIETLKGDQR